ncbi:MAG: hypothetical protein H0W49_13100 [Nitrospirales bacterium]|nr:hypothetical protein [Nitrospirales bacterium]
MKIQVTLSDQMGKDLMELQADLGLERIEDLTIHSWNVLRYLLKTIRNDRCTLSPEAVQWISQQVMKTPPKESSQETPAFSHQEIDTRILEEIHRLLDDDHIDQALKVTHILKILRSHGIESPETQQVKTEMLLTAAETFAAEGDPEHAAQLISDAAKETGGNT